ncbi:class I SAM-dependent methyltransferase [soil metagenome]
MKNQQTYHNFTCRFCQTPLEHVMVDVGMSPVANDYVKFENEANMEPFYPLKVFVCAKCFLVQLPTIHKEDDIFTDDYAYFSSYSTSWLAHAKKYVEYMMDRFTFTAKSHVVELASNDGYLLQYFKENNVPVLGVEPCRNVAEAAIAKGIPSIVKFFGIDTATQMKKQGQAADLIIGNNVLAHVPDVNDFVGGMKVLLKRSGIITVEFPHLLKLMELNQFDTIYHEHFSYYSFIAVEKIFAAHGITLFDVEELPTHGGSLRIFGKHIYNTSHPVTKRVREMRKREKDNGFEKVSTYTSYEKKVKKVKQDFLEFIIDAKRHGKSIVGYGAPAKGNTFLNYCGIRTDSIDYTVDANPHKQQHFLPGVRIPIFAKEKIAETKPDYVLILPWNLKTEIAEQMKHIREWGGKFVVAIPEVSIF